jgi:PAS domain S-box-containing protein
MSSKMTKFEGLLEAMPDALVGVDHAGVIRFVNRQMELLFGHDRNDLIGAPLETLVPESLRLVHKVHREGYVAAPFTRTMGLDLGLRGRRRDGTQFPVDIALSHTDTEDGPLVIAAVRDLTGRTKTEESRRRSERLAAIAEHSDDAIVGKTLDGINTNWKPVSVLVVVEDDPDVQFLVRTIFSMDSRFTLAAVAASAEVALESLRTTEPEIIVLDHGLSGQLTGLDAAPRLKELAPQAKIIMFTAHADLKTRAGNEPAIDGFVLETVSTQLLPLAQRLTGLGAPPK